MSKTIVTEANLAEYNAQLNGKSPKQIVELGIIHRQKPDYHHQLSPL